MSRFRCTPKSPYQIFLRLLESESVFSALTRILQPISKAIQECSEIIDQVTDCGSEDYLEAVTDEEIELIESLLGTAFVICQTQVTCVVSRIKKLHSFFETQEGRALGGLDNSKAEILNRGATVISGTGYSDVQVIDAFANYFKHRDEWPSDWAVVSGRQAHTVSIISAFGAASGTNGNLRTGASALGNKGYHSVSVFAEKLDLDPWVQGG